MFWGSLSAQHLEGIVKEKTLRKSPYKAWYKDGMKQYKPRDYVVNTIRSNINDVKIKVFFGSWCPDSKRELPRFFKILKQVGYRVKDVELIALNPNKESKEHLEEGYAIIYVPTFIFYKNGKELGRIIEQPIQTLEKDMYRIIIGLKPF